MSADKEIVESIENNLRKWTTAFSSADIDSVAANWDDGIVDMPSGVSTMVGGGAIRSHLRGFFDNFDVQIQTSTAEILVLGDWVFHRLNFAWTLTPKTGEKPSENTGKCVWMWKRQDDSSWKVSHAIWNLDN